MDIFMDMDIFLIYVILTMAYYSWFHPILLSKNWVESVLFVNDDDSFGVTVVSDVHSNSLHITESVSCVLDQSSSTEGPRRYCRGVAKVLVD